MASPKTNAMRQLDALGIAYEVRTYEVDPDDLSAENVAAKIGLPAEQAFKTLVVRGDRNGVCLAVIPGSAALDLKQLARVTGDRKMDTVHLKEVQPLTGYIRGGGNGAGLQARVPGVGGRICTGLRCHQRQCRRARRANPACSRRLCAGRQRSVRVHCERQRAVSRGAAVPRGRATFLWGRPPGLRSVPWPPPDLWTDEGVGPQAGAPASHFCCALVPPGGAAYGRTTILAASTLSFASLTRTATVHSEPFGRGASTT